jgi:anti-sigma B factor antagonist
MRSDDTAGPGDVRLEVAKRSATVEVRVTGDLDMAAAFKLETRLDALLATADLQAVVLDLAQVGFVDSAGLGAVLAVRDRAHQVGVDLTIAPVSDAVRRILDVTGLGSIAEG